MVDKTHIKQNTLQKSFNIRPPIRMLVVDDLELNYLIVRAMLKHANIYPMYFESGREAVEYVHNGNAVDIILMDYDMPGMNGSDAAIQIKSMRPNLPVISFSSIPPNCPENRNPYDGVLIKPVNQSCLKNLVFEMTRSSL